MGDFNYPGINWITFESDNHGVEFRDLILDNFLNQHVREPTREKNVLDLVLSTNENMIEHLEVIEHVSTSDHNTISWQLICDIKQVTVSRAHRQYARGDFNRMKQELGLVKWDEEFKGLTIEDIWVRFKDILDSVVARYVPVVTGNKKKYPQWMTREAKRARRYKANKWKEYRISGEYNDLVEYQLARKRADKEYKKAKRIFEEKIADNVKSNPKSFYAYVRSKTTLKEVVGPLRDKEGRLLIEHGAMCNELNTFFASVFTKEKLEDAVPNIKKKEIGSTCSTLYITTEVIYKKLTQLKVGKAAGIDGIDTKVLIECAEELCKPLQILYNLSLNEGVVPKEWKLANVSALYKKGNKELAGNYRPVSLTSHVCKVMESVIKDVIVEYLKENELIHVSRAWVCKG
jgi:hypothetical protein